jgi:hypothetical protein
MTENLPQQCKIYNVSTFKRGCNTGTLKIISTSASSAFKIVRKILSENQQHVPDALSFRLLDVLPLTYKGPTNSVLNTRGVIKNVG